MEIAYILQVHKNPGQLNKFIREISSDGSDIYIHVDKKSVQSVSSQIIKGDNIKIIEESESVTWSDISQVDATLNLFQSLKASHKKYDFIVFKTGQDLLIKRGIKDYFENYPDKIFMNMRLVKHDNPQTYFWYVRWPKVTRNLYDSMFHPYRIFRTALIRLYMMGINVFPNAAKLPGDYALFKGSAYFCIPGYVLEYIINFLAENPWYYEAFRNALAPDESFLPTLIMNSPYAANVIDDNLTFIKFGKSHKDHNHPVTLTMTDIPDIESSGKFFARKFDDGVDEKVVKYFCSTCK